MLPISPLSNSLPPDHPANGVAVAEDTSAERIRTLEAELRELQHRAKNSLQLVLSLLRLQAGGIRDPDARAAFEQTLVRIEALAILYRQLHESGAGTHIDLVRYLETLCEVVKAETPGSPANISITITAEPIEVALYEAMTLGLIIVELMSNSLLHAFPEQGWIKVTVTRLNATRARLVIEDNGRPLPAGLDTHSDEGLMLAEALASQLGDTLSTDSDTAGTTAAVSFPI